jgi:hypothetical protein
MKLDKKTKASTSQALFWGGVIAIFFAAIGYLGIDIWLASTQWLLVAAVMGLFAVYFKLG